MDIILATEVHSRQIYELICELENREMDEVCFIETYMENLNDPRVYYYAAVEGDHVLGFVSLHFQFLLHHSGRIGEIQELVVHRQYRNTGIGHLLFLKVKEIAEENRCIQLEVCCNQGRVQSHEFYKKHGMTESHYKFCLSL